MAGVTSNIDEVEELLRKLADGFDFTAAGAQKSIGEEAADVVSQAIADRSIQGQEDPAGQPWAKLSPKYLARKVAKGYPSIIGVRTGQMLSALELAGSRAVSPQTVTITYGVTQAARDKMVWFSTGCSVDAKGRHQNRPPRPFWGLDPEIHDKVKAHLRGALARWVADLT